MSLVNLFDTGDIAIYNYHTHTHTQQHTKEGTHYERYDIK
mgnify:CR=1 FL=1